MLVVTHSCETLLSVVRLNNEDGSIIKPYTCLHWRRTHKYSIKVTITYNYTSFALLFMLVNLNENYYIIFSHFYIYILMVIFPCKCPAVMTNCSL